MWVTRARTIASPTETSITSPSAGTVARCCISIVSPSASPMRRSFITQVLSSVANVPTRAIFERSSNAAVRRSRCGSRASNEKRPLGQCCGPLCSAVSRDWPNPHHGRSEVLRDGKRRWCSTTGNDVFWIFVDVPGEQRDWRRDCSRAFKCHRWRPAFSGRGLMSRHGSDRADPRRSGSVRCCRAESREQEEAENKPPQAIG